MNRLLPFLAATAALPLSGCIVGTAAKVVTAPVKAAAQVVDWTTTSQSEADRNYGREVQKREEALGRAARARDRLADYCKTYPQYQNCYRASEPVRTDEAYYALPR